MKHLIRLCVLVGVLLVLPLFIGQSHAQFPGMDPSMNLTGMMRDMQFGPLALLSRSEVQKELKLNKSQIKEVEKLQKEQSTSFNDRIKGKRSDPNDTAQMMQTMKEIQVIQTDLSSRAKALLTDEQRQRLGEVRLQAMGLQAFQDPELQTALAMTPDQKTSLSALNSEYMLVKANIKPNIFNAGSYKKKMEAREKEYQEKSVKILTADQNSLLKKMQGEPYKDLKKITG